VAAECVCHDEAGNTASALAALSARIGCIRHCRCPRFHKFRFPASDRTGRADTERLAERPATIMLARSLRQELAAHD
jgi:hypothetical protein